MRRMSSLSILFAARHRAARNLEVRDSLFTRCSKISALMGKIFVFCAFLIADAIRLDLFCLFRPLYCLPVWNAGGESPNCLIYFVERGAEADGCASSGLIYRRYSGMCTVSQIHHEFTRLSAVFVFIPSAKCSWKKAIISVFNWQLLLKALSVLASPVPVE